MWAKILAADGGKDAIGVGEGGVEDKSVLKDKIVYIIGIEGDAPDKNWSWWEKALDALVQAAQPAPALTHVELFVPPDTVTDDPHFATYLGKNSGWGRSFGDSASFYLDPDGNGSSWRAVPIMAHDAVKRLRAECERHVSTPYGSAHRLYHYPFAVPPLRSLAWTLSDAVGAPAHCATLTARCLRNAIPELNLTNSSAWYGPSTLFLELVRNTRMESYAAQFAEMETLTSTVEQEDATHAVNMLLRGSNDSVIELTDTACQMGIEMLTKRCITASVAEDATVERLTQKQLARALLRYSIIHRRERQRREVQEQKHARGEKMPVHPVYSHLYKESQPLASDAAVEERWLDDDEQPDRVGNRSMFRR